MEAYLWYGNLENVFNTAVHRLTVQYVR